MKAPPSPVPSIKYHWTRYCPWNEFDLDLWKLKLRGGKEFSQEEMDSCMVRTTFLCQCQHNHHNRPHHDYEKINWQFKIFRRTTCQEPLSSQFYPSMADSTVSLSFLPSIAQFLRSGWWWPSRWQAQSGRTAASLACTHSKPIHKLDVPLAPWPVSDFPRCWCWW